MYMFCGTWEDLAFYLLGVRSDAVYTCVQGRGNIMRGMKPQIKCKVS
jgi:hypothetical protein